MNIEGVSSEILRTFIQKGYISDLPSIYKLKDFRNELIVLPGFKEKSIDKILASIEKSKNQDLAKFIFGLGIRHLGSKNSSILARRFGSLESIMEADLNQLINIRDLGPKVSESIVEYFGNEDNKKMIFELFELGLNLKESEKLVSNIFEGKTFVITGTLSMPRNYFKAIIDKNNGNVSGSVSKNTDYLLAGENAGSKLDKAKGLGVIILKENDFEELLKGGQNG